MSLDPAVAAVRRSVRTSLTDLDQGRVVAVGCSGGADSLALLAGAVFEGRKAGHTVVGVTVDHALQAGSDSHAESVVGQMRELGVDEAVSVCVALDPRTARTGGPEAAARAARYVELDRVADEVGAAVVLLGHTRDDQAETVLLGLARGSGARSLSGMAAVQGRYRRPLLDLGRADTEAACRAEGIEHWLDPHNEDRAYTRVRVRHDVLPVLERELGPGIAQALARTARLLRDDADALDGLAAELLGEACPAPGQVSVPALLEAPAAVRRRVLRRAAAQAGCPETELFLVHVDSLDALVVRWRGQQEIQLPGHVTARRSGGILHLSRSPVAG